MLQVVSDFTDVDAEFAIFRRMAEESGRPLSFSLVQVRGDTLPPSTRAARPRRTPTACDDRPGRAAPGRDRARSASARSIRCSTNRVVPRDRGAPARRARRGHVGSGVQGAGARRRRGAARRRPGRRPHPPALRPDVRARRSARLRARRRRRASRPGRAREGRDAARPRVRPAARATAAASFLYLPFLNYADGNLDAVGEMLAHPNTVVGLATAARTSARSATRASRPRCSTLWVRDRDHGRLDLPFLVQRHTQRDRAHRRAARPRRARARVPRRRQRDRLRAPHGAPARRCITTSRPAASGSCSRPTVTSRRSSPAKSRTRTARRPARFPAGSFAARNPRRRRSYAR